MMPPIRSDQNDSFDDRTSSHLDNNTGKSMIDSANLLRSHVQSAHSSAQYLSQLSANSSASLTPKLDHNGLPLSQQQKQQTQQQQYSNQQTPLTKAELRKSNKPIMEKKRRARINHCLNELKTLILEAMKKDPARHTKLEKADILEMTVKYLQTMQRNQVNTTVPSDPAVLHKFKAGFADCTDEVNRYINQIDGVHSGVKQRLIGHLNNCVSGIQQVAPSPYGYSPTLPLSTNTAAFQGSGLFGNSLTSTNSATSPSIYQQQQQSTSIGSHQDINNNGRNIQMGGVNFIPSRLPTGELALVVPNSGNLPYFPSSTLSLSRNYLDMNSETGAPTLPRSAFNSVSKSNGSARNLPTTSPPLSPISASSMSSCEDSSHTDLQSSLDVTPPFQTSSKFLSAFPTPPSGGSITLIPVATVTGQKDDSTESTTTEIVRVQNAAVNVQQPHVTSTTEQLNDNNVVQVKPLSVITNSLKDANSEIQYVNKKRPYPIDGLLKLAAVANSEPSEKLSKTENSAQHPADDDDNANGDMWRPW